MEPSVDARPGPPGEAPPPERGLVLLPGLGADRDMWAPTLTSLASAGGLDVVFGPPVAQTGGADDGHATVPSLGAATARRLRRLPHRHLVLVGHSLGCLLAVDLATRLRGRASGLVLVNGGLGPAVRLMGHPLRTALRHPRPAAAATALTLGVCLPVPPAVREAVASSDRLAMALFAPFAGRSVAADPARRRSLTRLLGHPRAAAGLFANRHHWPRLVADARQVPCAVWLVAGTRDPIAPRYAVEELRRMLPHATVSWVPGGRHTLPLEEPDTVARVILAAAEETAPTGAAGPVGGG